MTGTLGTDTIQKSKETKTIRTEFSCENQNDNTNYSANVTANDSTVVSTKLTTPNIIIES